MLKSISIFFAMTAPAACYAVDVGDITSFIESNQTMLTKEVANTTDVARYIGLRISRLSTPVEGGVIIDMESKSEVLSTPASLVLPGEAKDFFRISYQGPQDDKERYYRLSWLDAPVSEFGADGGTKVARATTSAQIDTILVVAPRKENFKYSLENGVVKNLGNSTFRIVSVGACKNIADDVDGKGCRERYFVMPGDSAQLRYTDAKQSKTHIGIWHKGQYISVK